MSETTCSWTRMPDGRWAVQGPLEVLRAAVVKVAKKSGGVSTEFVGTPIKSGRGWIAYPIKCPTIESGGSWLLRNWRVASLDTNAKPANTSPGPWL